MRCTSTKTACRHASRSVGWAWNCRHSWRRASGSRTWANASLPHELPGGAEERVDIELYALGVGVSGRLVQRDLLGLGPAHRGDHDRPTIPLLQRGGGPLREHRVRTHLDEHVVAVRGHGLQRRREPHRLAHVGIPIPAVEVRPGLALRGHGRVQRQVRRAAPHVIGRSDEIGLDLLHVVAVVGDVDANEPVERAAALQLLGDLLQDIGLPREGEHARSVEGRDRDPVLVAP